MLPRVNVVLPTDAFHALSMDEARQLNEDGGDPITGDDYPRGREAQDDGATFRITTRGADGRPNNQYYDAATLWRWAQDHRTDPRRNPWFREDWMALHDQYAPGSPVPPWVNALQSTDDRRTTFNADNQTTYYWDDSLELSPNPRVAYKVTSDGVKTYYVWNTEKGINYRSMIEYPIQGHIAWLRGSTQFFEFYDQPDPLFQSTDRDWNYSRLVKHRNPTDKWTRFYEGPARGGERMVRQQFKGARIEELWHYGNTPGKNRGDEYKVKVEYGPRSVLKGQVWYYQGTVRGEESLRKITFPNGQTDYYADYYMGQQNVRYKSVFRSAKASMIMLRYDPEGRVINLGDELTDTTIDYTDFDASL